jgi:hypothetical protein
MIDANKIIYNECYNCHVSLKNEICYSIQMESSIHDILSKDKLRIPKVQFCVECFIELAGEVWIFNPDTLKFRNNVLQKAIPLSMVAAGQKKKYRP